MLHFSAPRPTARTLAVWQRNFLVWRKLAVPSVLGNLADPMIYMLGFGYGVGALLPSNLDLFGGVSYIAFLAGGSLCAAAMNSATFEALYSGFSRMHVQKTWDAIMNAPVSLDDVMLGEMVWAASKAALSGAAILVVVWLLGLSTSWLSLWLLPLVLLVGLAFAGLGLIMTALAPSYDFFMYYFTLFITPMTLLSGVFFPIEQLPPAMQAVAQVLPLTHAVAVARPLLLGQVPGALALHLVALALFAVAGFWIALALARRRLLT